MNISIKYFFFSAILFFLIFVVKSRDIIFQEEVNIPDSSDYNFGLNGKNYVHFLLQYGVLFGSTSNNDLSSLHKFSSSTFGLGLRYKRKLTNYIDLTGDFLYVNNTFRFKQDTIKTFPSIGVHNKEFLLFNNLLLNSALRINFNKRGNIIRNYMDVGVLGEFSFSVVHEYIDKNVHPLAGKTMVRNYRLKYINPWQYSAFLRVGFKKISVFAQYRVSNIMKSSYLFPELPRYKAGIELGLF